MISGHPDSIITFVALFGLDLCHVFKIQFPTLNIDANMVYSVRSMYGGKLKFELVAYQFFKPTCSWLSLDSSLAQPEASFIVKF